MFREVCRARDRNRAYSKAAKIVTNGGIVISDRYPLPQVTLMDSPYISEVLSRTDRIGVLSRLLVKWEEKYYVPIRTPEILIVLRVDPDVAVQRKTDEDPTEVRLRSTEIWEMDWGSTPVHIVDGQQPASQVLSQVKSLIWAEL
jgi:thymidylate kinase